MSATTPDGRGDLRGHRADALGRSPFRAVAPSVVAALGYALATLVWVVAGDHLPGGRWLGVHLFTLGVVTNLVLAMSDHFGRTLARAPGTPPAWQPAVLNIGVLTVLVGIPTQTRWAVGLGATIVTAVVLGGYWRLRRMRRRAVGARFGWIVRMYERAHGAFVHGAALGLLMGVGLLPGAWYQAARVAHLHVNVLGWGGLTLLATLVFFGPTMARAPIRPGADQRAARVLRHAATGLTVAVVALLATGVGGTAATWLRLLAAAGLGVFAWAATLTCLPVALAARAAKPSATRWPLVAVCCWLGVLVWVDVAVVAAGRWGYLDAVGLAALAGVLFQAVTTTLTYLAPQLRGRSFAARDRIMARLERGATLRTCAFNLGVAAVVAAAAVGGDFGAAGAVLSSAGWALIGAATGWQLLTGIWPVRASTDDGDQPPRSRVVRSHR